MPTLLRLSDSGSPGRCQRLSASSILVNRSKFMEIPFTEKMYRMSELSDAQRQHVNNCKECVHVILEDGSKKIRLCKNIADVA